MVSSDENEEECYGYVDLFKAANDVAPYQTYKLMKRVVRIGRDHSNEIRVHSLKVSRLQCALSIVGDAGDYRVSLENRTDKKTTVYNNEAVPPQGKVVIYPGDRFRCHEIELRYRDPSDDRNGEEEQKAPVIRVSEKMSTPSPKQRTDKVASSRKRGGDLRKFLLRKSVMGKDLTKIKLPGETAADASVATTAADSDNAADANQQSANDSMEGVCSSPDEENEVYESFEDESIVVNPPSSLQCSDVSVVSGGSEKDLIVLSPMEPVVTENSSDLINFEEIEGEMSRLHGESDQPDESSAVEDNAMHGTADNEGEESDSSGETRESVVDAVDEEDQMSDKLNEEDNEKTEKRDSIQEERRDMSSPKGTVAVPTPSITPVKHNVVEENEDISILLEDEHYSAVEDKDHSEVYDEEDKDHSEVYDEEDKDHSLVDEEQSKDNSELHDEEDKDHSEVREDEIYTEAQENITISENLEGEIQSEVQEHIGQSEVHDGENQNEFDTDVAPPQSTEYSVVQGQAVGTPRRAAKSTGKVATPSSSMIVEVAVDVVRPESRGESEKYEPVTEKTHEFASPKLSMSTSGFDKRPSVQKGSDVSELFADLQDEDDSFEKPNETHRIAEQATQSPEATVSSLICATTPAWSKTGEAEEEDEVQVDDETSDKLNSTYVVEAEELESPKAPVTTSSSTATPVLSNHVEGTENSNTDEEGDSSPILPESPAGQDQACDISASVTTSASSATTPVLRKQGSMRHSSLLAPGGTPSRLSFMKTLACTPTPSKSAKNNSFAEATPLKSLLTDLTNMVSPCYVVLQRIEVVQQEGGTPFKTYDSRSDKIQENLSPKRPSVPSSGSKTPELSNKTQATEDEDEMKEDESPIRLAESSTAQIEDVNISRATSEPAGQDPAPDLPSYMEEVEDIAPEDDDESDKAESPRVETDELASPKLNRTFNCTRSPVLSIDEADAPPDNDVVLEKSVTHLVKAQELENPKSIATSSSSCTTVVAAGGTVDDIVEENDDLKNVHEPAVKHIEELESSEASDSVTESPVKTLKPSPTPPDGPPMKDSPMEVTPKSSKKTKSLVKSVRKQHAVLTDAMSPCFVVLQRVEIQEQESEPCATIRESQAEHIQEEESLRGASASTSHPTVKGLSSAEEAKEGSVEYSQDQDEPEVLDSTPKQLQKIGTPKNKVSVINAVTPVIPKKSSLQQFSSDNASRQSKNWKSQSPVTVSPMQSVPADPTETVSPCYVALQRVEVLQQEGAKSTSRIDRNKSHHVDLDTVENIGSERTTRGRKRKPSEGSVVVVEKISKTLNQTSEGARTRKKNQLGSEDPESSSTPLARETRRRVPKATDLDESKSRTGRKAAAKLTSPQPDTSLRQRTLRNRAVKSKIRGAYAETSDQEGAKDIISQSEEESRETEKQPTKTKGVKNGKSAAKSKEAELKPKASDKTSNESDEESSEQGKRSISEEEPKVQRKKQATNESVTVQPVAKKVATKTRPKTRGTQSDSSDTEQSVVVLEPAETEKQVRKMKVAKKSKPAAKSRATRSKPAVVEDKSDESDEESAQHSTKSISEEEPKDAKNPPTKAQQAKKGKSASKAKVNRAKPAAVDENSDESDQESSEQSRNSFSEEDSKKAKKPAKKVEQTKKGKPAAKSRATRSKPAVVDDRSDESDEENAQHSAKSISEAPKNAKKPPTKAQQAKKGKSAAKTKVNKSNLKSSDKNSGGSDQDSAELVSRSNEEDEADEETRPKQATRTKRVQETVKSKAANKTRKTRREDIEDDEDVQIVEVVPANSRRKRKDAEVDTASSSNTSRSKRRGPDLLGEATGVAVAPTPEPTGPPTKRARNKADTPKLNETVPQRQLRSRK